MMRIAVAGEGNIVTEHFGHCVNFLTCSVKNRKITNEESLPNPGHKPGFLPNFPAERGVNVISSGGMGGGAVDIFNGGAEGNRTLDLVRAKDALSQLSHCPTVTIIAFE